MTVMKLINDMLQKLKYGKYEHHHYLLVSGYYL